MIRQGLGADRTFRYLRLTDCSQVSDGGSALILATEEGLRKAGVPLSSCVEIIGNEYGCGNLYPIH